MARFTSTFIYFTEIEHEFEIEADTKEKAIENIKNDPLKYATDFISVYERDGYADGYAENICFKDISHG